MIMSRSGLNSCYIGWPKNILFIKMGYTNQHEFDLLKNISVQIVSHFAIID